MNRSWLVIIISLFGLIAQAQVIDDDEERPDSIGGLEVTYYDDLGDEEPAHVEAPVDEFYFEEDDETDDAIDIAAEYIIEPYDPIPSVDSGFSDHRAKYDNDRFKYTETPIDTTSNKDEPPIDTRRPLNIGGFLKVIFYTLLIAVIGFVIYLLVISFGNFDFRRRGKAVVTSAQVETLNEEEEVELEPLTLRDLIETAKQQGEFRLAVRYYFLLYLEQLQSSGQLVYDRDKTNADYLSELSDEQSIQDFAALAYTYEFVWYGKIDISTQLFEKIENKFNQTLYRP